MTATPIKSTAPFINPRIARMIRDPVLPTLLRLTAPNLANAAARAAFLTLDAWFVSFLGSEALAGVTLVFPFFLLMQTMAASAMGGGMSSSVARALGAGDQRSANALVLHGIAIAIAMSLVFMLVFVIAGPALYSAMGASGAALDAAITYSLVVFSGGVFVWLMNMLVNAVRGTGNMIMSSSVIVLAELVHIILTPMLILGFAFVPSFGVAGAGLGVVASYAAGTLILVVYLLQRHSAVRLTRVRLERKFFDAILSVGSLSSLNTLQTQAIYIVMSNLAAMFGGAALAGYGVAARLELTLLPLVFTVGTASVTMIGANIGAEQHERAVRVAWTGAAIGAALAGSVGILAAIFAAPWMALFTDDPATSSAGASYLMLTGPTYALMGAGMALFYAAQGFGSVTWPVLAVGLRLLLLSAFGWFIGPMFDLGLTALFVANAATIAGTGFAIIAAFWLRSRTVVAIDGQVRQFVIPGRE